ncbi:MAG: shikimate kinase, partial [Alphaproteobacteria bacterium]
LDADTRARIAEKSPSVWLRADLEVLYGRVARRTHRPLLNTDDQRETLAKLIEQRYPIYAEADIVVDSIDGPHGTIVTKILDACALKHAPQQSSGAGESPR